MTSRAWLDNGRVLVSAPYGEVEAVPALQWDTQARAFVLPLAAIEQLRALDDLKMDAEVAALMPPPDPDAHWKTCDEAGLPPVPGLPDGGWVHQRRAYWWALNKPAAYLEIGMGGGKTAITARLIAARDHRRVLVVCPKKVVPHWPAQLIQWGIDDHTIAAPRDGALAKRLQVARWAIKQPRSVVVLNYAALLNADAQALLRTAGFDLIVLDEAQNVKAHNGATSKALWRAVKKAAIQPRRLLLSGTSMPHSPGDIFAQYRFLDERVLGTSFTRFRARYAVMHPMFPTVKEWVRQDELAAKLTPHMFRVGREVLDLPPVQHIVHTITLGARALRLYREMEREFYAAVEDGEITASNALTKLLRLQTIAAGHVRTDEGTTIEVDTEKREALAETLDELPLREKVVVFCRFRQDLVNIRKVAEQQGRRYGEVSGERDDLVDSKFPPDVDVLGVQIQAGGAGIDLSAAAYCVYYTVGFSLGDYEQSLARTHRPGQTRSVTYVHLVAEKTVDQKVYAALDQRRDVVRAILERVV